MAVSTVMRLTRTCPALRQAALTCYRNSARHPDPVPQSAQLNTHIRSVAPPREEKIWKIFQFIIQLA